MSKLSKAERDKLPSSKFVDSDGRRFPIVDGNDVHDAARMLGRATGATSEKIAKWKARLKKMAADMGLSKYLPKSWGEAKHGSAPTFPTPLSLIQFATEGTKRIEGDYVVYPACKLFEDGDYPSHDFEMDPDELSLVPELAERVPLDLEHRPTVIQDDLIGYATNFETAWEGEKCILRGDVCIHQLLDPLLKPETKLSTTWDRDSRELTKVALLLNPRIPDAALQASYAAFEAVAFKDRHDTKSGQRAIQALHDMAARSGAVCDKGNVPESRFASRHESTGLQAIHDTAVQHGASCEGGKGMDTIGYDGYYSSYFSGEESGKEAGMDKTAGETGQKPNGSSQTPNPSAEFAALQSQMAKMQADLDAERKRSESLMTANRRQKAATFADGYIRAEKVKPGVRDTLIAFAERAIADDEASAVEFSLGENKKGGRLDALAQLLDATPSMGLASERIRAFGDGELKTLGEGDLDRDGFKDARSRIAERAKRYAGVKPVANGNGSSANGSGAGGK